MLSSAMHRAYKAHDSSTHKAGVMCAAISIAHDISLANGSFDVARFYRDITVGHTA